MIPLRRRPLEKGRGRVYRDRMSGQWFADFRDSDGLIKGVWVRDATDGNQWCLDRMSGPLCAAMREALARVTSEAANA